MIRGYRASDEEMGSREPLLPSTVMALCLLSTLVARAQNPLGAIRGIVLDTSGARVPSASITVRNNEKSLVRQSQSDPQGEFVLENLVPGSYELTVNASGFAEAQFGSCGGNQFGAGS